MCLKLYAFPKNVLELRFRFHYNDEQGRRKTDSGPIRIGERKGFYDFV